jgi:hypothetical protein
MAQNYLKRIQKEFSHIEPFSEDDLEWWNEGLDLIDQGKLVEAEKKFKMLVVTQPEHSDGFEGLSKVYSKMNRIEEAKYFIDLAVVKAKKAVKAGHTDQEIFELILEQQKALEKLKK